MKKLLLVDDNSGAQQVLQDALGDGYKLFFASVQSAVGIKLENEKPQLVLVNVSALSGKAAAVAESLIKSGGNKKARLVLMGGEKTKQSDYGKLGALDFLPLPMELDELCERLEEAFVTVLGLRDEMTGCYKRAFIESKIRESLRLMKKSTMFLMNIDAYSFVSNSISGADLQLCVYAMRKELGEKVLLGINGDTLIGFFRGEERHEKTLQKMQSLIAVIQEAMGGKKVYTSIGIGNASEYDFNYEELFLDCDRAIGVSRSRGKNCGSYYRKDKTN